MAQSQGVMESIDNIARTLAGNREVVSSKLVVQITTGDPAFVDEVTIQSRRKDVRPAWMRREENNRLAELRERDDY